MKMVRIICLALFLALSVNSGATTSFNDSTGNHLWADPDNWTGGLPTSDNGAIDNEVQCIIDANMVDSNSALVGGSLYGPGNSGGHSTLTIYGDLQIDNSQWVVGNLTDSEGTVNFESGTVEVPNGPIFFGKSGTAYVNFNGSNVSAAGIVHFAAGGAADANMSDGSLTCGDRLYISNNGGECTFNISGGTLEGQSHTFLGRGSGGFAQLDVSDEAIVDISNYLFIGTSGGSGVLNISGGLVSVGGNSSAGANNNTDGEITVSGGTFNTRGLGLGDADGATGILAMTGGTVNVNTDLVLAAGTGSVADVSLLGGELNVGDLIINNGGHFSIEQGQLTLAGDKQQQVYGLINDGYLTGYGSARTVSVEFDGTNTIVTADQNLIYYAYDPQPFEVDIFERDDVVLGWQSGDGAYFHQIYFGEDFEAVRDANTSTAGIYLDQQTGNTYALNTALEPGRTYYWRVDELDSNGDLIMKGRVWSLPVHANYIIDDFESYADDSELQSVWSGTPILDSDYISGADASAQSLAFDYDPDGEVTVQFDSAKDFVEAGVESLIFQHHPDARNDQALLYVKLTDSSGNSSIVTMSDANDMVEYWKSWQQWPIAISEFSGTADLGSVKKVSFGVSDSTGTGAVNIDNIALYLRENFDFASLDAGDLDLNYVVDTKDLDILQEQWLSKETDVYAETVSDANILFKYDFEEDSGQTVYDSTANGYDAVMNRPGGFDPDGSFDGSGAMYSSDGTLIVDVSDEAVTTIDKQITVAAWVKPAAGSMPLRSRLFDATASDPLYYSAWASLGWPATAISGTMPFHTSYLSAADSESSNLVGLNIPQIEGQWNHVAFVKDASQGYQCSYINGEMVAIGEGTRSMAPVADFFIANTAAGTRGFVGWIDDFRVYDRALSQGEIISLADRASVYQPLLTEADINEDGFVDMIDFSIMADNWLLEILWP